MSGFNPPIMWWSNSHRVFDGLARTNDFRKFLADWFRKTPHPTELGQHLRVVDPESADSNLSALNEKLYKLRANGDSLASIGIEALPLSQWRQDLNAAVDLVSKLLEPLYEKREGDLEERLRHPLRKARQILQEIDSHLDATPIYLTQEEHDVQVRADLTRSIIVVGEAGSGKSHLFADAIERGWGDGRPALLLLGQYFHGKDLRRSFLDRLDLADQGFETVLQALNAAGEAARTRCMILIDALNEATDLRVWPDDLAGFVFEILSYEWLCVGVSCRPEYEQYLIPDGVTQTATRLTCRGIQSPKEQEHAAVQYFEKRGIVRPAVPWLAPEFSNFLFLKVCCDSLRELGLSEFPRGLHGAEQVLRFYFDSVASKVRRRFPETDLPAGAVRSAVQSTARKMGRDHLDYVEAEAARDICQSVFGTLGPRSNKTWLSVLSEEGVFRKDHLLTAPSSDQLEVPKEIYRFTYQHFSDHLIVEALLREHTNVRAAFQPGGGMHFLVEHDAPWEFSTLWGALAVQIPEKHSGLELLDLIPQDRAGRRASYYLKDAFKQSILWRASSAFSERTLELFNKLGGDLHDPRLEILIRLATLQDHPWNARRLLDPFLRRLSMPERDAFWTIEVNGAAEDGDHAVWVLVWWCLRADLSRAEKETLRLAATILCWLFTSSHRRIRDTSTKALIAIITARPGTYPDLLPQFVDVDDLYVGERVCAAGFGAVCRGIDDAELREIAKAVYQAVFLSNSPPLNINLRDYARATIELVATRGGLPDDVDFHRCQPPYGGSWPLEDTTKDELERIAETAGDKQILRSASGWGDFGPYEIEPKVRHFSATSLADPRPLNNEEKSEFFKKQLLHWSKEKQKLVSNLKSAMSAMIRSRSRGFRVSYAAKAVKAVQRCEAALIAALNDKERTSYEKLAIPSFFPDRIPAADQSLPRFDATFSKRWVARRAYEYGWSTRMFSSDGQIEMSHGRPSVERIGKKYQWLALSELLARLADNVWAIEEWPDRAQIYDHPAYDWFVRDIEPSILADPAAQEASPWWQACSLEMEQVEDADVRAWPFRGEPPNSPDWLDATDATGQRWLLLYGLFSSDERREEATPTVIGLRRQMFVRVSSIIVKRQDVEAALQRLRGTRLSDPSDHGAVDWTDGPFLCEYPWRNTWSRRGWEAFEEGARSLKGLSYIRPIIRHVWESHLDASLSEGLRFCLPHPWIGQRMGLRPNLQRPGQVIDGVTGNTVFLDPDRGGSGSVALVNVEKFSEFLRQENLECLWFVAGERNSYPSGQHGDYACRYFGSVYRRRDGEWFGNRWHEDERGPN